MKTLIIIPFILLFSAFSSNDALGRTLQGTAKRLGQEMLQIGIALGAFGIIVGGIYLVLGKQDAGTKLTQAVLGLFTIVLSGVVVKFVQGLA